MSWEKKKGGVEEGRACGFKTEEQSQLRIVERQRKDRYEEGSEIKLAAVLLTVA